MAWVKELPTGALRACWRDATERERSHVVQRKPSETDEQYRARVLAYAIRSEERAGAGETDERDVGKVTVRELHERRNEAARYAPETLRVRQHVMNKHVPPAVQRLRTGKLTSARARAMLDAIEAPVMRERVRTTLSRDWTWGAAQDPPLVGERNPWRKPAQESTREAQMEAATDTEAHRVYLTDEEVVRLLDATPDRWKALVYFSVRCGVRPGEAVALTTAQVDGVKGTVTIDRAAGGPTKTGRSRRFKPAGVVMDRLAEHIAAYSDPTDPTALVFVDDDGSALSVHAYNGRFKRWAKKAGLPEHLSPNDLRHSYAAWAITVCKADVYSVATFMGHKKPSITLDIYGSLFRSAEDDLRERMDRALEAEAELRPAVGQVVPIR